VINRLVIQEWNGEDAEEGVDVRAHAEATDDDEVALHAEGGVNGRVSFYMSREEAATLGVLLIGAAHASRA